MVEGFIGVDGDPDFLRCLVSVDGEGNGSALRESRILIGGEVEMAGVFAFGGESEGEKVGADGRFGGSAEVHRDAGIVASEGEIESVVFASEFGVLAGADGYFSCPTFFFLRVGGWFIGVRELGPLAVCFWVAGGCHFGVSELFRMENIP